MAFVNIYGSAGGYQVIFSTRNLGKATFDGEAYLVFLYLQYFGITRFDSVFAF